MRTWMLVMLALLTLSTVLPEATAARQRVKVDLEVDADLQVVARARGEARYAYEWTWGDGARAVGAEARHAYEKAGKYEVELKVTDEETGECWTERKVVRVEAARKPSRERAEEDDHEHGAEASASLTLGRRSTLGVSAQLGGEREEGQPARSHASSSARVRAHGDDHDVRSVPTAGPVLVAALVGAAALLLGRRR